MEVVSRAEAVHQMRSRQCDGLVQPVAVVAVHEMRSRQCDGLVHPVAAVSAVAAAPMAPLTTMPLMLCNDAGPVEPVPPHLKPVQCFSSSQSWGRVLTFATLDFVRSALRSS